MKASRRKFFGFVGGAAVAGPAAAKSVVEPLTSGRGIDLYPTGAPTGVAAVSDAGGKAKRIAELLKKLSGLKTPTEIERGRLDALDNAVSAYRYEVDGLRSVAVTHKLAMIRQRQMKVMEARERFWWQDELEYLRRDQ